MIDHTGLWISRARDLHVVQYPLDFRAGPSHEVIEGRLQSVPICQSRENLSGVIRGVQGDGNDAEIL